MANSSYRFGDICKYDYNVYDKEQHIWKRKVGIGLVILSNDNMVYVCEGGSFKDVMDKRPASNDENESNNTIVKEEVKTEEQSDNKETKKEELDTLFVVDKNCSPLVVIDAFFDLCYSDNHTCNEYLEYLWTINHQQEITAKIKLINAYDAGMIFDQEVIKFIKSIEPEIREIMESIKMIKEEQETIPVVVSVQSNEESSADKIASAIIGESNEMYGIPEETIESQSRIRK